MSYDREVARAARIAATPTADQVAAGMDWLLDRLAEQAQKAATAFRRAEVAGLVVILGLHRPKPMDEWDQRVWPFRAKCGSESWRVYTDGEQYVAAPCLTVVTIARPYAELDEFPEVLRAVPA